MLTFQNDTFLISLSLTAFEFGKILNFIRQVEQTGKLTYMILYFHMKYSNVYFQYYIKGCTCALIFSQKYNLLYICYLNCQPAQPACWTFEFHQTQLTVFHYCNQLWSDKSFLRFSPRMEQNYCWMWSIAGMLNFTLSILIISFECDKYTMQMVVLFLYNICAYSFVLWRQMVL